MAARGAFGSRYFQATEVLQRRIHTVASEMWGLGVVTYCLLSGALRSITAQVSGYVSTAHHTKAGLLQNWISEGGLCL